MMSWKIALAAAGAALLAPLAHLATTSGPVVTVSGGAWTGQTRVLSAPAAGVADPSFALALEKAAHEVCEPANPSLRNAEREATCAAEALAGAKAEATASLTR